MQTMCETNGCLFKLFFIVQNFCFNVLLLATKRWYNFL